MLSIQSVRDGMNLASAIQSFILEAHSLDILESRFIKKISPKLSQYKKRNGNLPDRLLIDF